MVVTDGPRVCTYSLGCIIGIYYILWASLTASVWAVLELWEYTIFMHVDTMGFMHAKFVGAHIVLHAWVKRG